LEDAQKQVRILEEGTLQNFVANPTSTSDFAKREDD
jgi:hypothetical protein